VPVRGLRRSAGRGHRCRAHRAGAELPRLELEGEHLAGEGGQDTITVVAGRAAWTVRPSPRQVVVEDGAADQPSDHPRATVEGAPDLLLRWLWGRADDGAVRVTGDPAWVGYLRRMLVSVTR